MKRFPRLDKLIRSLSAGSSLRTTVSDIQATEIRQPCIATLSNLRVQTMLHEKARNLSLHGLSSLAG